MNRHIRTSSRMALIGAALLIACGLISFSALSRNRVVAHPGGLDPTFGTGGIVNTNFSQYPVNAKALAIQSDGKLVAAGVVYLTNTNTDVALVRYTPDGSLDVGFGSNGRAINSLSRGRDEAHAVAIQSDGKIIIAGVGNNNFALARFNVNGSLDTSFGTRGKVVTPVGTYGSDAHALILQSDGKIVVAGSSSNLQQGLDFTLARYNTNGTLDPGFGVGGIVVTPIGMHEEANAVAIQSDGKIVAAGYTGGDTPPGDNDFALVRYNPDGSLDSEFGTGGKVRTQISLGTDVISSMALQPNGKIIVAGTSSAAGSGFGLARYEVNGQIDTTFGSGGMVVTSMGGTQFGGNYAIATAVAIQSDGKIVAAGRSSIVYPQGAPALVRYTTNGVLDYSFGTEGKVFTYLNGNYVDIAAGALQADGKMILIGFIATAETGAGLLAMRYQDGDSSVPQPHRLFDFDGDGRADLAFFRPQDGTWHILQSSDRSVSVQQWGLATDRLVPADYDGDGKTDFAIFRDGTWYRLNSSTHTLVTSQFGLLGDVPVPDDYDGDAQVDLAVFRQGTWHILRSTSGYMSVTFGLATDKPVPGDFDGDGQANPAVYRDGFWYLLNSNGGLGVVHFGASGDRPVVADYDGDRKADFALFRNGTWYLLRSSAGYDAGPFGPAGGTPAVADYDGDGKADVAVFFEGTWYILRSVVNGSGFQQFGTSGDVPVPAAYVPQ